MTRTSLAAAAARIAIAAGLTAAGAPIASAQVVGVSAAVKNDVRIRVPGTPLPRPVQVKQRVALRDQVQTGVKSQLQVLLLDKSVFTVGANARLTIDRYVYDPSRNTRSFGATVARGAFRFASGRRTTGGTSTISTPVASIGVRGTIVEGVVGEAAALIAAEETAVGARMRGDPATASLIVLRGPGRATQGNAAPGSITVTSGGRTATADRPLLAIYVPGPGMAPIGPFPISPGGLMQLQALLHPALADRFGWRQPADNLATVPPGQGMPLYPAPRDRPRLPRPPMPGGGFDDEPPGQRGVQLPNLPNLQPPPPRPRTQAPPPRPTNQPTPTPQPRTAAPPPPPSPAAAPTPTPTPNQPPSSVAAPPPPPPPPPPSLKSAPPPPPPPQQFNSVPPTATPPPPSNPNQPPGQPGKPSQKPPPPPPPK